MKDWWAQEQEHSFFNVLVAIYRNIKMGTCSIIKLCCGIIPFSYMSHQPQKRPLRVLIGPYLSFDWRIQDYTLFDWLKGDTNLYLKPDLMTSSVLRRNWFWVLTTVISSASDYFSKDFFLSQWSVTCTVRSVVFLIPRAFRYKNLARYAFPQDQYR